MISKLSIIEGDGEHKMVRMANLAIVGSHKVGCSLVPSPSRSYSLRVRSRVAVVCTISGNPQAGVGRLTALRRSTRSWSSRTCSLPLWSITRGAGSRTSSSVSPTVSLPAAGSLSATLSCAALSPLAWVPTSGSATCPFWRVSRNSPTMTRCVLLLHRSATCFGCFRFGCFRDCSKHLPLPGTRIVMQIGFQSAVAGRVRRGQGREQEAPRGLR